MSVTGGAPVVAHVLAAIVEASPAGVLAVSPDRRVLAVNQRFFELWGLPPASVAVGDPSPALGSLQRALIVDDEAFEAAIRWGHEHPEEPQRLDVALVDGRTISGTAAPVVDDDGAYLGRVWFMRDVTEERALTRRLATAERASRFLLGAADALARSTGFTESLRALAATAVPTLGDLCLIDVLAEGGGVRRVAAVHADPAYAALARRLEAWPPEQLSEHPGARAMRERRSMFAPDMPSGLLDSIARSATHDGIIASFDPDGYLAVPLMAGDVVLGALTLLTTRSGRRLDAETLALAEELAGRMARIVAKERHFDLEQQAAHALQGALLPLDVQVPPPFEAAVRYLPATRQAEVGGDFFDLLTLPDGGVAVAVGDVEGHDMVAAAEMAQLRSALRALRPSVTGPGALVDALRAVWHDLGLPRLATAVVARLSPAGTLRVASAGHLPPLLVAVSGTRHLDVPAGPPLGVDCGPAEEVTLQLPPDATVVFYTDGLVEQRSAAIDERMAALTSLADACATLSPDDLVDRLIVGLTASERSDDVAVLALRAHQEPTSKPTAAAATADATASPALVS